MQKEVYTMVKMNKMLQADRQIQPKSDSQKEGKRLSARRPFIFIRKQSMQQYISLNNNMNPYPLLVSALVSIAVP
jgi:hypothetical protein